MKTIAGKIQGKYKVEVVHPDGSITFPLGDRFHKNMVLNSGLNMLFNGAAPANATSDFSFLSVMAYARIGSGNAEPEPGDQTLGNQIRSTGTYVDVAGNNTVTFDGTAGTVQYKRTFEFSAEITNTNYNEVGVSNAPEGGSPLFARALFGSTVTVVAGSFMRLTYVLELRIDQIANASSVSVSNGGFNGEGDLRLIGTAVDIFGSINQNGSLNVSGLTSLLRGRLPVGSPANIDAQAYLLQNSTFPAVGSGITATFCGTDAADSRSNNAVGSYTLGNYYRDYTFLFPVGRPLDTVANARSILFGTTSAGIQWLLDANQTKATTKSLSTVLRVAWSRP
jgi:hypothetical protein